MISYGLILIFVVHTSSSSSSSSSNSSSIVLNIGTTEISTSNINDTRITGISAAAGGVDNDDGKGDSEEDGDVDSGDSGSGSGSGSFPLPVAEKLIHIQRKQQLVKDMKQIARPKRAKFKRTKRPKIKLSFAEPPVNYCPPNSKYHDYNYYNNHDSIDNYDSSSLSIIDDFSQLNVNSADFGLPSSSYDIQPTELDFYNNYGNPLSPYNENSYQKPKRYKTQPSFSYDTYANNYKLYENHDNLKYNHQQQMHSSYDNPMGNGGHITKNKYNRKKKKHPLINNNVKSQASILIDEHHSVKQQRHGSPHHPHNTYAMQDNNTPTKYHHIYTSVYAYDTPSDIMPITTRPHHHNTMSSISHQHKKKQAAYIAVPEVKYNRNKHQYLETVNQIDPHPSLIYVKEPTPINNVNKNKHKNAAQTNNIAGVFKKYPILSASAQPEPNVEISYAQSYELNVPVSTKQHLTNQAKVPLATFPIQNSATLQQMPKQPHVPQHSQQPQLTMTQQSQPIQLIPQQSQQPQQQLTAQQAQQPQQQIVLEQPQPQLILEQTQPQLILNQYQPQTNSYLTQESKTINQKTPLMITYQQPMQQNKIQISPAHINPIDNRQHPSISSIHQSNKPNTINNEHLSSNIHQQQTSSSLQSPISSLQYHDHFLSQQNQDNPIYYATATKYYTVPSVNELPISQNNKQSSYDFTKTSYEVPIYAAAPYKSSNDKEDHEIYPPNSSIQEQKNIVAESNNIYEANTMTADTSLINTSIDTFTTKPGLIDVRRIRKRKRGNKIATKNRNITRTKHILDVPELQLAYENEQQQELSVSELLSHQLDRKDDSDQGSRMRAKSDNTWLLYRGRTTTTQSPIYSSTNTRKRYTNLRTRYSTPTVSSSHPTSHVNSKTTITNNSNRSISVILSKGLNARSTLSPHNYSDNKHTTRQQLKPTNQQNHSLRYSNSNLYKNIALRNTLTILKTLNNSYPQHPINGNNNNSKINKNISNDSNNNNSSNDNHKVLKSTTRSLMDTAPFKSPLNDIEVLYGNLPKNHKLY